MWVKLGTFDFSNEQGQYIKISDKAPNSTGLYVVADAVRIATFDDIVSVELQNKINKNYIIFKNYPNPFNPSTKLYYKIPENMNVNISVYNILGNKIATLKDGFTKAGEYTVDFNAENLPAGIYFAILKTQNNLKTIKMQLIK